MQFSPTSGVWKPEVLMTAAAALVWRHAGCVIADVMRCVTYAVSDWSVFASVAVARTPRSYWREPLRELRLVRTSNRIKIRLAFRDSSRRVVVCAKPTDRRRLMRLKAAELWSAFWLISSRDSDTKHGDGGDRLKGWGQIFLLSPCNCVHMFYRFTLAKQKNSEILTVEIIDSTWNKPH